MTLINMQNSSHFFPPSLGVCVCVCERVLRLCALLIRPMQSDQLKKISNCESIMS